jgi:erythromycin esterase
MCGTVLTLRRLRSRGWCWSPALLVLVILLVVRPAAGLEGPGENRRPRRPQSRLQVLDREVLPGIFELDTIDPSPRIVDLEPLGRLIGDANVVALGESMHTSGGYYRVKNRVFRYLVEELGFRVFTIESSWHDAELVADYVATCGGSAEYAVTEGLFTVWASETVRDLAEWMCNFNQLHPDDPVAFWGFDIQQPWYDGGQLLAFLEAADVEVPGAELGILSCNGVGYDSSLDYYSDPGSQEVSQADWTRCNTALDTVEAYFDEHQESLEAATSAEALTWARVHLVGLRAWEGQRYYFDSDRARSIESRDLGMAVVFQTLREMRNPGDRVFLWAHNYHVAHHSDEMVEFGGARTMGTFLEQELGDDYRAIGLTGYEVWVDWPGVAQGLLPLPSATNEVEYLLHTEIGRDVLFVDLAFGGSTSPFLAEDTAYVLNDGILVPATHWDALIHLEVSPAMSSLLW